ncbi:MAG: FAD-binding oxidoreductase [Angelakisella sp.]
MATLTSHRLLPMCDLYEEYLRDESRLFGSAEYIAFPENEGEVAEIMQYAAAEKLPVTVQGSRTGITGAAVPSRGLVLNLSRMNRMLSIGDTNAEGCIATVESGMLCAQLSDELARRRLPYFFAPDPTETSASLGGIFACNAQGIAAMRYGKAGGHVLGLRMVQWDGSILELHRGECIFDKNGCTLPDGRQMVLPYMDYARSVESLSPAVGSDMIDLLAGSEGMLGIVTQLTLQLLPIPNQQWGVLFFFRTLSGSYEFMNQTETLEELTARIVCMEFFDEPSLELAAHQKTVMSKLKAIPDMPEDCCCAVYIELEAGSEEAAEELLMSLLGFFEEAGGKETDSWAACGLQEMEKFRLLRHAVPEGVNNKVDTIRQTRPAMHKIALDFSCTALSPGELIEKYRLALAESGVDGVIFGHAATRHLHVNLLPLSHEEETAAKQLVVQLAGEIAALGGCLAEENGIGKLKNTLLSPYISAEQRQVMVAVRNFFDPEKLLNPHNMLP